MPEHCYAQELHDSMLLSFCIHADTLHGFPAMCKHSVKSLSGSTHHTQHWRTSCKHTACQSTHPEDDQHGQACHEQKAWGSPPCNGSPTYAGAGCPRAPRSMKSCAALSWIASGESPAFNSQQETRPIVQPSEVTMIWYNAIRSHRRRQYVRRYDIR